VTISLSFLSKSGIDKAVEAAEKAFQIDSPWRKLEPAARASLMRNLADLIRRDVDYLSVRFTTISFSFQLQMNV
jgi:acyl-CoA reductase-like NAD-dependent aldehyde dehydrogenase